LPQLPPDAGRGSQVLSHAYERTDAAAGAHAPAAVFVGDEGPQAAAPLVRLRRQEPGACRTTGVVRRERSCVATQAENRGRSHSGWPPRTPACAGARSDYAAVRGYTAALAAVAQRRSDGVDRQLDALADARIVLAGAVALEQSHLKQVARLDIRQAQADRGIDI